MKQIIAMALLLASLGSAGCPKPEQDAYRTVVGAKAFIDSVKSKHPECGVSSSSALCADLRRATSAKDVLIDAGEIYCNVAVFGDADKTPCMPTPKGTPGASAALATLRNAIANYERLETNLKAVIQ